MVALHARWFLVVFVFVILAAAAPLSALPVPPALPSDPTNAAALVVGEWSLPVSSQVEAIHTVLLPTGKVLYWQSDVGVRVYDPATGSIAVRDLPYPHNIFCSGQVLLPDGRVMVVGGTLAGYGFAGEDTTFFFDPWTETWSEGPRMHTGRWYPTPVVMGDDSVMVFSGLDATGALTSMVERWSADGGWQIVPEAAIGTGLFPRLSLLPSGDIVRSSHEEQSLFLDADTMSWTGGPWAAKPHWQGSSILLPGLDRILVTGGANGREKASADAAILDLASGEFRTVAAMHLQRRDHNMVLLPDGDVVATGGATGPGAAHIHPVDQLVSQSPLLAQYFGHYYEMDFRYASALNAEVFDSETETWSLMAPAQKLRSYHSTSVLLPDGRVWTSGSDYEVFPAFVANTRTIEIFSPPNLFRGERPVLSNAPDAIFHGDAFVIGSDDVEDVAAVSLVRFGATTHAFNFDQRWLGLDFDVADGVLTANAPSESNEAPPGWYMLFLVGAGGAPSEGHILRLG